MGRWSRFSGLRGWTIGLFSLVVCAIASPLVSTAGLFGTDAPSRIPVPAKRFSATFEDISGTVVQTVSRTTFNGEVFVYGRFGAGQVTVPFDKIAEVRIEKAADPLKRIAIVTLKGDEEPVRVELEDDTPWYGQTRFGNYKVEVRDLRVVRDLQLVPAD